MPIIKSAKKRVRVAHKAAVRNSKTKRSLRTSSKAFTAKPSIATYSSFQSQVDKAAKKSVIHKNKAARLKSRAAASAKASGLKLSKKAKPTASAKKTTTKKTTAKKK